MTVSRLGGGLHVSSHVTLTGDHAMSDDTLATLARVKGLALAALIDAGGTPCWVRSDAAEPRPPAPPPPPPPSRREAVLFASLPAAVQVAAAPVMAKLGWNVPVKPRSARSDGKLPAGRGRRRSPATPPRSLPDVLPF
jgi:hypothetical protein